MGTRLQSVLPRIPKPLARLGNMPFLQLLVLQLRSQGIRHLLMCTGYLGEQIEHEFGDGHRWDVNISYSLEPSPLGTAGALKFAERHLSHGIDFLVMNGDSFVELDFRQFIHFHQEHGGLISMAVRRVPNAARYGTVRFDTMNRIIGFTEKTGTAASGAVNAGVYVFSPMVLEHIPNSQASLEKDIFPRLLEHGIYAAEQDGMFIDIGTPEDYARCQKLCRSLQNAAHVPQ